jgi:ribosomal protein L7/L12
MKISMNVTIREDLVVSFDVLTFTLHVLRLLQRTSVRAGQDALVAAQRHTPSWLPGSAFVEAEAESEPSEFKIALIKTVRHLPGHTFSLLDAKNIVEFLFENQQAIQRLAEAAR